MHCASHGVLYIRNSPAGFNATGIVNVAMILPASFSWWSSYRPDVKFLCINLLETQMAFPLPFDLTVWNVERVAIAILAFFKNTLQRIIVLLLTKRKRCYNVA
jgi:hypothetical protein